MSKFSALLKDNKLLFISFGLSIAVITLGVLLIILSPENNPASSQVEALPLTGQSLRDSLDETESLIINTSKSGNSTGTAQGRLVRGSEDWCEQMMLKSDKEWSEADMQLFGQKCL